MASGSVNKVILVGNLGRDAELRATPGGLEVISFSVATTERKRDHETNQWTDQVEWHRVKMFRDTQKSRSTVHEYLKKGQKVYVEGRLQTRSWDDKDGQKKYSTEIISDRIELLGRKEGGVGRRRWPRPGRRRRRLPGRRRQRRSAARSAGRRRSVLSGAMVGGRLRTLACVADGGARRAPPRSLLRRGGAGCPAAGGPGGSIPSSGTAGWSSRTSPAPCPAGSACCR